MKEKIRDNGDKIKQNKVLPYLVGNVVEVRTDRLDGQMWLFILYHRSWMLIPRERMTGQTATWTQCARANVPS